jgi:uncharacterized membrane protein
MQRNSPEAWKVLIVPACVGYQALMHRVLVDGYSGPLRLALAAVPLLALGIWVSKRAEQKLLWTLAICVAALGTYAFERYDGTGLAAMNALTHAAINVGMLWLFGRTLGPGREPLIASFARRIHGALTPEIEIYTRRVTFAWCVFFVAQLVVSAGLLAFASIERWSFFINVLSLPLVVLMFLGEYMYRVCRYRDRKHVSLVKGMEVFLDGRAKPAATAARIIDGAIVRDVRG